MLYPHSGRRTPGMRELLEHPQGPTAWQLNWWTRKGWIKWDREAHYGAEVPEATRRRLIEMARLVAAGVHSRDAAKLSELGTVRANGQRVIPAGPGITIIVDPPDKVDT